MINNVLLEKEDVIITHFLSLHQRPDVKKVILSCHEKNLFEVSIFKFQNEIDFAKWNDNKKKNFFE